MKDLTQARNFISGYLTSLWCVVTTFITQKQSRSIWGMWKYDCIYRTDPFQPAFLSLSLCSWWILCRPKSGVLVLLYCLNLGPCKHVRLGSQPEVDKVHSGYNHPFHPRTTENPSWRSQPPALPKSGSIFFGAVFIPGSLYFLVLPDFLFASIELSLNHWCFSFL